MDINELRGRLNYHEGQLEGIKEIEGIPAYARSEKQDRIFGKYALLSMVCGLIKIANELFAIIEKDETNDN